MKKIILMSLLSLLTSSLALANAFDNFIGEYKTSSSPQITAKNAKWCNRFDFKNIVGLKVEANTKGSDQSHVLYILNTSGWSGHPIMDFAYTNEFRTGGSYAKTSGSSSTALNEYGTWGSNPNEKESLTVTIEKTGADFIFSMNESLFQNTVFTAGCSYQVKLVRK
jgi:hypothetical protein